ncbi:MAG: hypothetical protein A3H91_10555 [Gammaproteobacteria bacterium RIFCSPLOWO2_02_FULL_61_13]|nr:MAG: hypothetical protein A3H91_10555 [Gammaproteobacteria bacterium RIFCSPLOWO2_02_FULL_61_13]
MTYRRLTPLDAAAHALKLARDAGVRIATAGLVSACLTSVSGAGVAVAVTGYAGPGGGNERNPVGTVFVAAARRDHPTLVEHHVFSGDRDAVRLAAVGAAIALLTRRLS